MQYLIRASDYIVLMYDISDRKSIDYVIARLKDIDIIKGKSFRNILIIGNKCDMDQYRQIKFPVVNVIIT